MTPQQTDVLALILSYVVAFFTDPRSVAIYLLLFVDLMTGIMAAIRTQTFDLKALGAFLWRDVVPFLLGYLTTYVAGGAFNTYLAGNPDPNLRPFLAAIGVVLEQLGQTVGWGAALLALMASIGRNLNEVQTQVPQGPLRVGVRAWRDTVTARIIGG